MKRILYSALAVLGTVSGAFNDDIVEYLPEMGNFTEFKLYSGYLDVSDSGKYLHYVLAESQNDPSNDPLVIWFNGGPGCSSMLGFLQEHGPYVQEDDDDFFHKNDYSWNKEANMLYIESPAGVGYSYCTDDYLCNFDDYNSSSDNLLALLSFYKKFPEYKTNDLYISGESYAGVYIPFLAWRIDNFNSNETNQT
jgi:carboxypeptidase C (cathepsin A)